MDEQKLETEIDSLKIRLARIEEYLRNMPDASDYLNEDQRNPDEDPLLLEAKKIVQSYELASSSLLQRRLSIGYARAARLLDELEEAGVVGPANGPNPREVIKV